MKSKIIQLIRSILKLLNPICSRSKLLTHIRYFFFPEGFYFEQYATLSGIAKFEKSQKSKTNINLLRRNIHRLEKALTYPNRRNVFAKDYILETTNNFLNLSSKDLVNEKEYKWSYTVLKTYFDNIDLSVPEIAKAKEFFLLIPPQYVQAYELTKKVENNRISFEDYSFLTHNRRSVRQYQNKKVPRDIIDQAIQTAMQSPSACNRQPFEFRVFDNKEMIKKIASIPYGTGGFVDNFPCYILIVGKLDAYFHSGDRHAIYIDASLALMSFVLALETLGLSSCIFNWPSLRSTETSLRKTISLEEYEVVVTTISVGYADSESLVPTSVKKNLTQIRNYNRL